MISPVIFTTESFESSLSRPTKGDFVYIDPPYAPEKTESFVGYNSVGFTHDKHMLLFESVKRFEQRGIYFVMSNSNTPMVTTAFKKTDVNEYNLRLINCKRTINSKHPGTKTTELLITNLF
jgi:DNA adenine methylase